MENTSASQPPAKEKQRKNKGNIKAKQKGKLKGKLNGKLKGKLN